MYILHVHCMSLLIYFSVSSLLPRNQSGQASKSLLLSLVQLPGWWPELHGRQPTGRHGLPPRREFLEGLPGKRLPSRRRLLQRPRRRWTQGAFPGFLLGQWPLPAAQPRPALPQVCKDAHPSSINHICKYSDIHLKMPSYNTMETWAVKGIWKIVKWDSSSVFTYVFMCACVCVCNKYIQKMLKKKRKP